MQGVREHLIFFDNDCALCHRLIVYFMKIDLEQRLVFAPLGGRTAQEVLIGPNMRYAQLETLILVEEFRSDRREFWVQAQAIFRIYWLLGNRWVGWLSYLPSWLCDGIYRSISKHRHRLNFGWERQEFQNDRFLP